VTSVLDGGEWSASRPDLYKRLRESGKFEDILAINFIFLRNLEKVVNTRFQWRIRQRIDWELASYIAEAPLPRQGINQSNKQTNIIVPT
jgi:hypothetical protein